MRLDRPLDHKGLEVLTVQECLALLGSSRVGRVAFVAEGTPVILPVNHVVDGWTIAFLTGAGPKLAAADMRRPMALEIDGYDEEQRIGWSVLVQGIADVVWSPAEERRLWSRGTLPWIDHHEAAHWVRIVPDTITGRRILRREQEAVDG